MHLVGFDAAGETVELRLTARDRSAYAAGILAAADWLRARRRASPASTPSTRSSTSSSLATPSLPEPPSPTQGASMTLTTRTTRPSPTRPMLRGAFTALVTPFTADGALDEAAFRRLVRWQVLAGIDGLVPCGTTGESPTLIERRARAAHRRDRRGRRASGRRATASASSPGTGTNDTAATIRATRRAAELGADAALVVAPYYNRPDGRMLEAHFRAIADEGDLPIVVYNVPSRTGTNVDADTFLRLAEHPRVVAVKEASGNLEQIARICRDRPRDVAVLAGDDAWTLPILAMGGDGVVSVASNEIPGELVALCAAARAGDWDAARRIHERWLPLFLGQLPWRPEPGPAKAALVLDGPARDRHRPGAAPAARAGRRSPRWPPRSGRSAWSSRPVAGFAPRRRRRRREAVA